MKSAVFITLLAACIVPSLAQAQSFNCRYARSPDEVLICQSDYLSSLDSRLSRIYFQLRNDLHGGARRRLVASQSRWLASRRGCGRDFGCVKRHYQSRIRALLNY